jgi:hypothetical protein
MNRPQLIARLCGWLVLLVHLAGQAQGLPLFAAAVAALDGEHGVELASGQSGLRLVLHHDRNALRDNSPPSQHHHRGLIRLLAGADGEGPHPDHLLQFTSSPWELKAGEMALSSDALKHPPVSAGDSSIRFHLTACATQTKVVTLHWGHRWWPPAPAECTWGFVVLVI